MAAKALNSAKRQAAPSEQERLLDLLNRTMFSPSPPLELPAEFAGHRDAGDLFETLLELRRFMLALSKGRLDHELKIKGYLAGALKGLQANLRHLTWQTKVIASGDFSQRIDFMGEFSESFNSMVAQLDNSLNLLKEKEAALIKEIEERKKSEEALRQSQERYRLLAITDPLTGLLNRRHFFHLAGREMDRAARYQRPVAVAILDIDFFKQVNDNYGHACGDQVLRNVAQLASNNFRTTDIVARYGGEEFIFMMPETPLKEGLAAAERLRSKICQTSFEAHRAMVQITVSMGLSSNEGDGEPDTSGSRSLERLISQADQALYQAKGRGRNLVCQAPL